MLTTPKSVFMSLCLLCGLLVSQALAEESLHDIAPELARPLGELSIRTSTPEGVLPEDRSSQPSETPAPLALGYPLQTKCWTAAATRHRPLYFEEINAERYGYARFPHLQPLCSTAHFFATVPAFPYLMTADRPCDCVYTQGHYRVGACVPWRRHRPIRNVRGGIVEAVTIVGLIALIP